jgi:hypothetical protein
MCCWKSTINHGTSDNSNALANFVSCSLPVCLHSALLGCSTWYHLNFRCYNLKQTNLVLYPGHPLLEVNLDWYLPWLTRFVYSEYDSCFFLTCWLLFHLFFVRRMQHRHIISLHLDEEKQTDRYQISGENAPDLFPFIRRFDRLNWLAKTPYRKERRE